MFGPPQPGLTSLGPPNNFFLAPPLGMILETKTPTMAGTGDIGSCQINSLFLQYVIEREKEENIFPPLEIFELKGKGSRNPPQRVGQHLTIASSWKRDKFVLDNMDFSRLRSLTVSREWRRFLVSDRMRVLRVLDLEDTNVNDDDIEQIMKRLPRLKFLSLRRCIKVTCLPGSLGDLRQLQTLDIRHTSVSTLPKSINKLQKLQYMCASAMVALMDEEPTPLRSSHGHDDACDGITVPRGIGALMCLHTLDVVNISATGAKTILKELKNLTQLNKLGVSGINRSNVKGFFSAIEGQSHLQSLSLQLHKDNNLEWLSKISLPGNLQRLKMYVHVVKYPNWSCLQVLGQIRRLQTLRLRFETDEDVALQFSDSRDTPGQFGEIEVLEIACSSNLDVKFTRTEMALLKMLKVHCLNGSSLQFSGIENLNLLKHVWIKGSFDDIVKEELRRKVGQHQMKPELLILD